MGSAIPKLILRSNGNLRSSAVIGNRPRKCPAFDPVYPSSSPLQEDGSDYDDDDGFGGRERVVEKKLDLNSKVGAALCVTMAPQRAASCERNGHYA